MTTPQTTPELPVVAYLRTAGTGSPVLTAGMLKSFPAHRSDFEEPLVKLSDARAALAASQRVTAAPQEGVSVPPGFALVPLEPTREMEDAAIKELGWCAEDVAAAATDDDERIDLRVTFRAMIAAAPKPPASALPDTGNVGAELNWREVAVWWEQGAKDWQELKEIIPRMFNRAAALPPPGRGMVPMTEDEAVVCVAQVLPVVSSAAREFWQIQHKDAVTIVRAVEAKHGIKEGS